MRLLFNTKQELITKLNNGISINQISKELSLAKSTIYYYYKKINGQKYQPPRYEILFSEQEGEIVGIFAGDGSQYYSKKDGSYRTKIHFGNVPLYANYVKNLYEFYFNKKVNINFSKRNQFTIKMSNKEMFDFYKIYLDYNSNHKHDTVKLKTFDLPPKFIIGFLRGLLDTDGCICLSKHQLRIIYTTTSKELANQIKKLLQNWDIDSNIQINLRKGYKALYIIQIRSKSFDTFLKIIKPFKAKKFGLVAQW